MGLVRRRRVFINIIWFTDRYNILYLWRRFIVAAYRVYYYNNIIAPPLKYYPTYTVECVFIYHDGYTPTINYQYIIMYGQI